MTLRYKYLIFITILLSSCETIVKVDIPQHKPSIVVNSVIDPSEKFQVHLSKSLGSLDSAPLSNINNAEVEVYENDVFIEKLTFEQDGNYSSSNISAKLGRNYKIIAKAAPYDQVSAEARIPQPVSIENIVIKDSAFVDANMGVKSSLSLTINDPGSVRNYYMVELFETDSLYSRLSPKYITPRDPALESDDYSSTFLFSDVHFDGKAYRLEMEFYNWLEGLYDPVTGEYVYPEGKRHYVIEFSTISREYYLYKTSFNKQMMNSFNPFSEPVQVFSNINNGYGIFAGKVKISYQIAK
jgi:hypothetical protein